MEAVLVPFMYVVLIVLFIAFVAHIATGKKLSGQFFFIVLVMIVIILVIQTQSLLFNQIT